MLLVEALGGRALGGARPALSPPAARRAPAGPRRGRRPARRARRGARRRAMARPARGRARGRAAPAAVHPRAARRPRALPDRVRARRRLGGRADGRPALHARAARPARPRAHHAPRRAGHVPAADDRARSRSTRSTASATASSPTRGRGSRPPSACSRSGRRRPACSRPSRGAAPLEGRSDLFITPGFAFRRVDALLTNFHLPRTTLLALVMAFAGVERTRELYALADPRAVSLLLVRRRDARALGSPVSFRSRPPTAPRAPECSAPRTARSARRRSCPSGRRGRSRRSIPDEVRALGADVILGNTYHLHFRPGEDVIEELGGLHAFTRLGRADPDRLRRLPGLLAARHDRARSTTTA